MDSFSDEQMEELNNDPRNQKIIAEIKNNSDDYKKIIIYAGTIKHARNLCNLLKAAGLEEFYDSISYIDGKANSRSQDNEAFFKQEKTYERSIITNVEVLSEGYDDPRVNTVFMAAPTKSKLFYMQAVGRAIRALKMTR